MIVPALEAASIIFIDENGEGPDICLKNTMPE
jgi:hypothetical protein